MNKLLVIPLLLAVILLADCKSGNRSEEISKYSYSENSVPVNGKITKKAGAWVTEGTVCYGLITMVNAQGKRQSGLPVKARVMSIKSDSLKMKALENVSLAPVKGCKKMGLSRGESWWETEGELFKTKDEAVAYLKNSGLLK